MTILHSNLSILDAVAHPKIFKPWFRDEASWSAWRSFLCALFALPMSPTELAVYQECTGRTDPPTRQAKEAWLCIGRRGGKSVSLAALAVFIGAFGDFRKYTVPGERLVIPILAADRNQARATVGYVRAMITGIPMIRKMLVREVADSFELSNGLTIEITTASFRTARGFTAPLVICDEVAFWMSGETSANPDEEIIRGLRPSLSTIPNSMLLCASSPYAKIGELWKSYRKHYGHDGDVLVWKAPSNVMNPSPQLQSEVDAAYADDPANASAEYGAEFRSDVATFVDREVVMACIDVGCRERPFTPGKKYSAFVDPSGGSSDSFTLAIAHKENETHVIDVAHEIPAPFDPESAVAEIVGILKRYRIRTVTGDRYAAEWTSTSFSRHGIKYQPSPMVRSDLYLEMLPALNSKRVRLLDNQRLTNQLAALERKTSRGGSDSVDHPRGGKDDLANAVAGAIATAAVPQNKIECMSFDEFLRRTNAENWRVGPDGERKFIGEPPRVVPHPRLGLPDWMA
jgi:hypothetical protein